MEFSRDIADTTTYKRRGFDVICVADFHDLCPRQVRDFVGNLSRLCRKVGVMEFGLYPGFMED